SAIPLDPRLHGDGHPSARLPIYGLEDWTSAHAAKPARSSPKREPAWARTAHGAVCWDRCGDGSALVDGGFTKNADIEWAYQSGIKRGVRRSRVSMAAILARRDPTTERGWRTGAGAWRASRAKRALQGTREGRM